jgi:hypothetical protein
MSERERPSLSGLAMKRVLPERGKPVVSLEQAEAALLGVAGQAPKIIVDEQPPPPAEALPHISQPVQPIAIPNIHSTVPDNVQPGVLSSSLLKPKRKQIKVAWTFKMPMELHRELSEVAEYNRLSMSDIVLEALRFHLPNFPHPGTTPGN